MISGPVIDNVKSNKAQIFRRAYIKRMQINGQFESDWLEITTDVKRFGKITQAVDSERYNKVVFRSTNITLNNTDGNYLDEEDTRSLWFGYASQQRTLLKIEAGYVRVSLGADGIYARSESPGAYWDVAQWDDSETWDSRPVQFVGLISGEVNLTSAYEVNLTIMPLLDVLRNYPASALRGFTSTGCTASQFCELLRDQTDGGGSYVFRPFFDNTTTAWNVETTTQVYSQLNTSTAKELINTNVWEVVEKLAEAENFVAYISNDGAFNFTGRDAMTSAAAFEFYGLGITSREWGHTIKKIDKFSRAFSKFYSRVVVQYREENTASSYEVVSASLTVSGNSAAWRFGQRTLQITNFWIAGQTQAGAIASNTFENVSAIKRELAFTTVFIPGLNVLDRIRVSYDPSTVNVESLWDLNNWGDTTAAAEPGDLIWDSSRGDSFYLNREEMNIISVELDLDKLENKIVARET